jgi:ParB family chromosome partitioning protein
MEGREGGVKMGRADDLLRGFGSTFASSAAVRPRDAGRSAGVDVHRIEVAKIEADPDQPRRHFDEPRLDELAASLRQHGQLQPIRVRWDTKATIYRIVAGERRWRAAKKAGLLTLEAIILDDSTTLEAIRIEQVVENLQRDDLTKSDTARAYRSLMDSWGITARELAGRLGVSESTISRGLAVLKLPEEERAKIDSGKGSVAKAVVRSPRRKKPRRLERHSLRLPSGARIEIVAKPGVDLLGIARELLEAVGRGREAA